MKKTYTILDSKFKIKFLMKVDICFDSLEFNSYPFPHAVINNPFGKELEQSLLNDFPSLENVNSKIRMDKDITFPNKEYLELLANSKSYSHIHNYVYSESFVIKLLNLFKDEISKHYEEKKLLVNPLKMNIISSPLELNIQNYQDLKHQTLSGSFLYPRLDIGMGGIGYGKKNGGGGIHCDNETRLLSILYYVNTPNSIKGGDHRIYDISNQNPVKNRSFKPKQGLMIVSLQSNRALHDVDPIISINGYRKAFYLAISCNNKLWARGDDWLMKLTKNRSPHIRSKHSLKTRIKSKTKKIWKRLIG